uniref:succinate dehydrogenase subunit 4 n=1 Tax=Gracilaria multipartita TaxID=172945 RepID=UPI001D10BCAA|nr:succinate dehydrogenase subunit 4 [Gracilaria multipartita]UAD89734.1 succinate dehydrogenase subunit 4 [Gracilaria multipartita]
MIGYLSNFIFRWTSFFSTWFNRTIVITFAMNMFDLTWILMRLGGLFFFSGILLDVEVIVLIISLTTLHMNLGLRTILTDYIHIERVKITLLFLIRISSIEINRYLIELLL